MKRLLIFLLLLTYSLVGFRGFSQGTARVYFDNGTEKRFYLEGIPSQEYTEVEGIDIATGENEHIALEQVQRIIFEPNEEIDSLLFIPIKIYLNENKQVTRWVESLFFSENIAVFRGYYTKGLKRKGNTVYYTRGQVLGLEEYYYIIRPNEKLASVWFMTNGKLSNNISDRRLKKFKKQSFAYFKDFPILQKRIQNGEFGPADWRRMIQAYEEIIGSKEKSTTLQTI